jgi:hypothetical protein
MITRPLALHEMAAHRGMTHMSIITADDLTNATVAAAQSITLCNLVAGDIVAAIEDNVIVPFENTADAAFNTTTRSAGDTATGVAAYYAATQANKNGTVVTKNYSNTAVGPYTAADGIRITFNSMAAKSLSSINKGELHVFFSLLRVDQLSKSNTVSLITTK